MLTFFYLYCSKRCSLRCNFHQNYNSGVFSPVLYEGHFIRLLMTEMNLSKKLIYISTLYNILRYIFLTHNLLHVYIHWFILFLHKFHHNLNSGYNFFCSTSWRSSPRPSNLPRQYGPEPLRPVHPRGGGLPVWSVRQDGHQYHKRQEEEGGGRSRQEHRGGAVSDLWGPGLGIPLQCSQLRRL